jgi:hypothetical protein
VTIDPATGLQTELPTGSGFWGIQASLTTIYPSDPAVLYGGVSYLYNIGREVGASFGSVNPGDAMGFNFGMGFALNERISLSIGYDHSAIGKTKQNGAALLNSVLTHVGSLVLGYSFRLSDRTNLNLSLGAGLTEAAPDVQLTLRIPTCCFDIRPAIPYTPRSRTENGAGPPSPPLALRSSSRHRSL